MEKKTSIILISCFVIGAFGLTFVYLTMAQPETMNPIFLLVLPQDNNPTSNHPGDLFAAYGGSDPIDWILMDDHGPGQYRVWVNDTNDNYYVWVDWTVWTNNINLAVVVNSTSLGIYNYTIEFNDSSNQFGTPDTVIVTVIRSWTWVSGSHLLNQFGTYGTKGVAAASNVPGAREQSISWIDSNDTLWLFGGYGYNNASGPSHLNDLWKFNITSGLWTWVSGSHLLNQLGNYGTKGVAATSNVPGARFNSISWIDSNDTLWLFGGSGYNNASSGFLNDLWKFNIASGLWTWVSGSYLFEPMGNYGIKGVAAASNVPGARFESISWIDSNDNLWLFGGFGNNNESSWCYLNDLWKFNITSGLWTWVSGSHLSSQLGNYGTKGVAAASNVPGAKRNSISWIDSNDTLWLFGGQGYNNVSGSGRLNDLWKFNITSGLWTWVSGSHLLNQLGNYGTKGVAAASNVPGARYLSISWIDSNDTLWLFGGYGYNNVSGPNYINDLWKFNITSGLWTWVSGSYMSNRLGNYGMKDMAAISNIPGARDETISWINSNDTLWLFGGYGFNNATGTNYLNDLWKFT